MDDSSKLVGFVQLEEFCKVLKMGSDLEGLDILSESYPEIWGLFIFQLENQDILCDHDDYRFRAALAELIGGFLEE